MFKFQKIGNHEEFFPEDKYKMHMQNYLVDLSKASLAKFIFFYKIFCSRFQVFVVVTHRAL